MFSLILFLKCLTVDSLIHRSEFALLLSLILLISIILSTVNRLMIPSNSGESWLSNSTGKKHLQLIVFYNTTWMCDGAPFRSNGSRGARPTFATMRSIASLRKVRGASQWWRRENCALFSSLGRHALLCSFRRPRRQGGVPLGGQRPVGVERDNVQRAAPLGVPLRARAALEVRREGRRPRGDLHANGGRAGGRDARVRAHRRHPLGRLRRLLRAVARRPHPRREARHPLSSLSPLFPRALHLLFVPHPHSLYYSQTHSCEFDFDLRALVYP